MGQPSTASYIRTIAKTRSISMAAEELGISQPALSSFLKKMEKRVGASLFDRSSTPITITTAGSAFLDYERKAAALELELERRISDIGNLESGSVAIGGAGSFNVTFLPDTLARFNAKHPNIDVTVIDGTVPDLAEAALDRKIDLFITPEFDRAGEFTCEKLLHEKVFLCVPPTWPLVDELPKPTSEAYAIIDHDDFARMQECCFIALREDLQIGKRLKALQEKYHVTPSHRIVVDQTMTSLALTLAGVGISLATESAVSYAGWTRPPALYYLEDELCSRSLYAAYPKKAYVSQAALELIRVMSDYAHDPVS